MTPGIGDNTRPETTIETDDNTLVSDNPFINTGSILVECSSDVKQILESKFPVGGSVDWLIR